jgi:NAD(P)-dependent dehydrogenase (short-subunit alcohol dehydrogenase family)
MSSLHKRTALVTGAGNGIGRGIAQALAAAGAQVVVTARQAETGQETLALIEAAGGTGLAVAMDVTRRDDVAHAIAQAVARFGGLDIVVHNANAGGDSALPVALEDVTEAAWDHQASVAWDGALHCAQLAFEHLKASGHGRYIVLASSFGLHGAAMNPIYSALKGGDRGLVKALAREWGPHGITVNAIAPSAATEPTKVFFAQNPAVHEQYIANFSLRRLGDPMRDIGGAVAALCSDAMGYVTAQTLVVDGGLYTAL